MATTEAEMRQLLTSRLHKALAWISGIDASKKSDVLGEGWQVYRAAEAFAAQQAIKPTEQPKTEAAKMEYITVGQMPPTIAPVAYYLNADGSHVMNPGHPGIRLDSAQIDRGFGMPQGYAFTPSPAGAAPEHASDALEYATARAADGPTYRSWYDLDPSEQKAIRQQMPKVKWPMCRWTLDRGRWVYPHDGEMANRSGDCPTCGHAISRHDPEDGTCDAPRAGGQPGVCPCGREDQPAQTSGPAALSGTEFEELEALRRFKAYVHQRLDELGVPADPKPELTKLTGCRIGYRLDWVQDPGAHGVPLGFKAPMWLRQDQIPPQWHKLLDASHALVNLPQVRLYLAGQVADAIDAIRAAATEIRGPGVANVAR